MPDMSRAATCALVSVVVLASVAGCSEGSDSAGDRTPSPVTPTATPSSYPISSLEAPFTEFCLSFPHKLKEDATSALSLGLVGVSSAAEQAPCDADVTSATRSGLGHIRIRFWAKLTAEQQAQAAAAVAQAYPEASSVGQDVPGLAVAFTVTPRTGAPAASPDSIPPATGKVLSTLLGSFGTSRLDNGDLQITYVGPRLSPAQLAKVEGAIAAAAGVRPAAVRLLPYRPGS
jgi:hypothetical protein